MSIAHIESFMRFKRIDYPSDLDELNKYGAAAFQLAGYRSAWINATLSDTTSNRLARLRQCLVEQHPVIPERRAVAFRWNTTGAIGAKLCRAIPPSDLPVIFGFSIHFPATMVFQSGVNNSPLFTVLAQGATDTTTTGEGAGNPNCLFTIRYDGALGFTENPAMHPFRFIPGRSHFVECRLDPVSGDVRVWVDDTFVFQTSRKPAAPWSIVFGLVSLSPSGGNPLGQNSPVHVSDFYILAEDGISPSQRLGPTTRVIGKLPAVDAAPNDMERPAGFDANYEVARQPYEPLPDATLRATEPGSTEVYAGESDAAISGAQLIHGVVVRGTMQAIDSESHTGESFIRSGEAVADDGPKPYKYGILPQFANLFRVDNESEFFESIHNVPGEGMFVTSRTLGVWACKTGEHDLPWVKVFDSGTQDFVPGRFFAHDESGYALVVPERKAYGTQTAEETNKLLRYDPTLGDITNPSAWGVLNLGIDPNFKVGALCYYEGAFFVSSCYIRYYATDAAAEAASPDEGIWYCENPETQPWTNVARRFTTSTINNQQGFIYPSFVKCHPAAPSSPLLLVFGSPYTFGNVTGANNSIATLRATPGSSGRGTWATVVASVADERSQWALSAVTQGVGVAYANFCQLSEEPKFSYAGAYDPDVPNSTRFEGVISPVVTKFPISTGHPTSSVGVYPGEYPLNSPGQPYASYFALGYVDRRTGIVVPVMGAATSSGAETPKAIVSFSRATKPAPVGTPSPYDGLLQADAESVGAPYTIDAGGVPPSVNPGVTPVGLDAYIPYARRGFDFYLGVAPDAIFKVKVPDGVASVGTAASFMGNCTSELYTRLLLAEDLPAGLSAPPARTMTDFEFADNGDLVIVGLGIFTKGRKMPKFDTPLPALSGLKQNEQIFHTDPATGAPFTPQSADAVEFGVRITS